VNHLVLQDCVRVDEEQRPQGDVLARDMNAIGAADGTVLVAAEREMESAQAALRQRGAEPALVCVDRVGADAEDIAFPFAELRDATADRGQLGRSDQREIARIEQQHQPAVLVVVQ
jgi:hypothetical protein